MFGPLSLSLGNYVKSSKTLSRYITPIAHWYAERSGYRRYGFRYDDLLVEERPDVQRALGRLSPREQYDRAFRLKQASQASVLHAPLPQEKWTKQEEDTRYLLPHVRDVVKEDAERRLWDTIVVKKH